MTKEEAIKTLKENYCSMCAYGSCDMDSCDISYCDNREAIEVLSAVLEREKGEWIKFRSCCREYKCSNCEYEHCRENNFCPNCGADMRPESYKGGEV